MGWFDDKPKELAAPPPDPDAQPAEVENVAPEPSPAPQIERESEASEPKDAAGNVLRHVNWFALLVGPPGSGKTSLAYRLLRGRLEDGSWLLAHDPNQDIAGTGLAPWFESTTEWARFIRAAKEQGAAELPRAAAIGGAADSVVQLAFELGGLWNRKRDQGAKVPIALAVDEASMFVESGSTYMGKLQNALLSQRRHVGIEVLYNTQRPTQLTGAFYAQATDAYLFRQIRVSDVRKLEEHLGFERGELDHLRSMPDHEYIHVQPGRGIVE